MRRILAISVGWKEKMPKRRAFATVWRLGGCSRGAARVGKRAAGVSEVFENTAF
jgi:hypothetical protein